VYDVVLLTLEDAPAGGCSTNQPRVPVLTCRDTLVAGGATVELVTAYADTDIDAVLGKPARLVVAAATDGQLRAVVRRLVRRYAPAPSSRPADLPTDRTLPDLPPIGVLPMGAVELVTRLGLPSTPSDVAKAVLGDTVRQLDLLRNDGGSVTLHGTLIGGTDEDGRAVPFAARVEVDDTVLADGTEPLLAAAVANADGYATVDGLPLLTQVDAADGLLDVAVAVPVTARRLFGRRETRVEVRRARGRAVAVHPRAEVAFLDDGVAGTLDRKRTWWMERGAWAVYAS
jgi:diacylglycerol kinase family enzyme